MNDRETDRKVRVSDGTKVLPDRPTPRLGADPSPETGGLESLTCISRGLASPRLTRCEADFRGVLSPRPAHEKVALSLVERRLTRAATDFQGSREVSATP